MPSAREHWPRWAALLRRTHLDGLAAWLLEAGAPLALLSAQALYLGRPFLGRGAEALARTLESEDEARALAAFITREPG